MLRRMKRCSCLLVLFLCFLFVLPVSANLIECYENPDTGFEYTIYDDAGLLDEDGDEIERIWVQMERVSRYGNAVLMLIDENTLSTETYAKELYKEWYQSESGTIFLIDMANRQLYMFSDGAVNKTITRAAALTITDNVYSYASKGDYEKCALEAFSQIAAKLEGGRITQKMRYLSAFFLAVLLALMLTFIFAKINTSTSLINEKELLTGIWYEQKLDHARRVLIHRTVTASGSDSDSSGGSGGGGGSSSGSGGGHGF